MSAATSPVVRIKFEPDKAMRLFVERNYDALSEYWLQLLELLRRQNWTELTSQRRRFLNSFLTHFGALFTEQDYRLSNRHAQQFIYCNALISNLTALSAIGTTDAWLEIVQGQSENAAKALTLYNARCRTQFDVRSIFTANRAAASAWYRSYFEVFHGGAPTQVMWENGRRQIEQADPRVLYVGPGTGDFYFFLSYLALDKEARIKRIYHDLMRPIMKRVKIRNRPNFRSIAVVTARWNGSSAVYKSLAPFVEALRGHYDLTLVQLKGAYKTYPPFDQSLFHSIRSISRTGEALDLSAIADNDFALVYFPDVGMQPEDRHLCDLRMAPIQVMGYGHPVSTHGAEVDYFVGGREVEKLSDAQMNYSERLVVIPGLGAFPVLPAAAPAKDQPVASNPLVVNCAWSTYKFNYPHLLTLRRIADAASRPVRFRCFVGPALAQYNQTVLFQREVEGTVGAGRVEIITNQPYDKYQKLMSEGSFSLDSYPFGGYNTIVDALVLGKPVVALEGDHAVNRLAAALLRRIGLQELVAASQDEYAALALKLIHDDAYREELRARISAVELESALCKPAEPQAFKRAIDFLIQNHEQLRAQNSREPIVID